MSADSFEIEQEPLPLDRRQIMPWIEASVGARLNAEVLGRLMPPRLGSFLHPTPDDPLKNMAWTCHGFLEAAADHLMLWADYAAPLKFHPESQVVNALRPAFTLARATIEAAAQAIWVLSPEEPSECGRRYIHLATWDLNEQTKAAATLGTRAELQERRDEILTKLGLTARTFRPPKYLDMIRNAAEFIGGGDSNSPTHPDRVERIWRSTAGAAHGKTWTTREFHDHVEAGDGLYLSTPKVDAISDALTTAESLLSAGVTLFALRAGRLEDSREFWDEAAARLAQRMTTASGEPLRPEIIRKLRVTSD